MAPRKAREQAKPATVASGVVDSTARVTKAQPTAFTKHKDGSLNLKLPAKSDLMKIAKKNTGSPLLRLPAEIRRMIWEYAVGGHRIWIYSAFTRPQTSEIFYKVSPLGFGTHALPAIPDGFVKPVFSLPQVCRQMYAETSPLVYSLNMFAFSWDDVFDVWIRLRTPAQKRATSSLQPPSPFINKIIGGSRTPLTKKFPMLKTIDLSDSQLWIPNTNHGWSRYHATMERISSVLRVVERDGVTMTWIKRQETVAERFPFVSRP